VDSDSTSSDNAVVSRNEITVRLGRRVRERREALGLSQEAFAAKCGLDRTYVSGIERGKRNVSVRNLEIVARGLGVSLSQLFKNL
jgi:transcriptional regulator with XRE-family HTH domain